MASSHGTYTMYARLGCRCDECREYQRARVERNRKDRLSAGRLSHGLRSAYDAGCRCDSCKLVRSKSEEKPNFEHNHITRDIKPEGQCPGCDVYHRSTRKKTRTRI